jgi:2-succinyl-6-hydroxy-2,4-cyclohexadiene-1-carboxylate synthase
MHDGCGLRIEVSGSGPALLLLHGFTGSIEAWPAAALAPLAPHFRLVRVDLLGHGGSSRCADPARYALDEQLSDLCRVLDALDVESAVWAGYSMGGRLALGAAALRPDRVRALVLESASPGLAGEAERRERARADEAWAERLLTDDLDRFVEQWMSQPLFASQQERLPAAMIDRERERRLRNDPASLSASLRGFGTGIQPSLWDRLAGITAPALLLTGERDAKFRDIAQRMARAMPHARTATIARCGHTLHLESPREWGTEVLRFCTGLA